MRNLELKARVVDLDAVRPLAVAVSDVPQRVLVQTDTYFRCSHGRLKLREIDGADTELIWYVRANNPEMRASDYLRVSVTDARPLREALAGACGVLVVVHKQRELFGYRNVRIHLDRVDGLGEFVELEAVLGDPPDLDAAMSDLAFLSEQLQLDPAMHVGRSYSDLAQGEA